MTDFESRFSYSKQLPERCCATCAYFNFGFGSCALKQAFDEIVMQDLFSGHGACAECGICRKWLSPELALAARRAGSLEEFMVAKEVSAGGCDASELEDMLAGRKSTKKMDELSERMSSDLARRGAGTPFPMMAARAGIDDRGHVGLLRRSSCFWSVHHWISENMPAWEDLNRARRREAARPFFVGF